MQDTVFQPAFGNRPRNMVGRSSYIDRFKEALKTNPGSRERTVLILGQRGYGKTVMLLEIADIAKKQGYIVASPTITGTGMLDRILEKIVEEGKSYIKKNKVKITGGNLNVLGFGAGVQMSGSNEEPHSFAYRLTELSRQLTKNGLGILILIDEVQASHEELKQLIIAYQEIIGEGGNIAIVMAGLPGAVSSTLNDNVLTFLNRARKIDLGPLNIRDVYAYYKNAFKEMNLKISDELCREAADYTEGSPYMMQLIGHNIIIYSGNEALCDKSTLDSALTDSKEDYINDIGKTTINALSDKDVEFLIAMIPDDDSSNISDIAQRMGVTSAYAQLYKRRLLEAGVIEQVGRGKVKYSVAYLKEYLERIAD